MWVCMKLVNAKGYTLGVCVCVFFVCVRNEMNGKTIQKYRSFHKLDSYMYALCMQLVYYILFTDFMYIYVICSDCVRPTSAVIACAKLFVCCYN